MMYEVDLTTEKPEVGRYLANDADLVSYLKNRGVLVPVEPDYEAMAEVMLQKIDVAAWWTRDNRQLLAEQLWAAGIGGDDG